MSPTNKLKPDSCDTDFPNCVNCSEKLCLRQKTINLAVGNTDIMYCLNCLAKKENKPAEEILAKIKKYILARECFRKEWIKYKDVSFCPKPDTCFPDTCFRK